MIYAFGPTLQQIPLADIDPERITAGQVSLEELKASDPALLGFSDECVEQCERQDSRFRNTIALSTDYMFCILSVRDIANVYAKRDRIGLFIRKNLFLIISIADRDDNISRVFESAAHRVNPATASLERIICAFFDRLYCNDNGHLERYNDAIDRMEQQVEKGATGKSFNAELLALRRKLLTIRNYYEQMLDITESLTANDADLFREEKLHHFRNLHDKITRLSNNTQLLRDNLLQVREAYQAALSYSENQIMKVFTVVTTVFLPLSLIAGWYGMNFTFMPELGWRFGYLGVIVLSVAVVLASFWFFRKKNLL